MGLHSPCYVPVTLTDLEAAGIAIVYHEEGWFIESSYSVEGPYENAETALEESVRWLAPVEEKQVGDHSPLHGHS